MPDYAGLRSPEVSVEARGRAVAGLQRLRQQLRESVPRRTLEETLLLATWNIRDLGNENKRSSHQPGPRLDESYYYIAEIIAAFDLVALQEVNSLEALLRIMRILGSSWDYITTDAMQGAGNHERLTFVYDTRKVRFQRIAGQVVLSSSDRLPDPGGGQFARTPFYASFQSNWLRFSLCTVHIVYGDPENLERRVAEVDTISRVLAERAKRTGENLILLGDFNILERGDPMFAAMERNGWLIPEDMDYDTDALLSKRYDQIAFLVKEGELQRGSSSPSSGAVNFFESVFRSDEWEEYYEVQKATGWPMDSWDTARAYPSDAPLDRRGYFEQQWRTWQVSDHFPLWVELKVDFTEAYLRQLLVPSGAVS